MRAMSRFERRHVVVTGAGTGIGRAIALRLAQEGAVVSLLARDVSRLGETARTILESGGKAFPQHCDVRDRASVDQAFAAVTQLHGPVYGLVANAGIGGPNRAGKEDRFDDLVATNLGGTYNCLRAAERHFDDTLDTRHVVVIASILARIGVAGYTGYCASKAGLLGLVRAAAMELAPRKVQVNAVCPGWVSTEMAWHGIDGLARAIGGTREDAFAEAMKEVPLGRMSEPNDVAGVVAWLLSPDARGVTGQGIDVNNGAWM